MRNRPQRLKRRSHERGSTMMIAVVMLFVIVAMMELMLSAPNAELLKVKSTVAKEHATASANAGAIDAMVWVKANASNLSTLLDDPTSGSSGTLAGTKHVLMTYQQRPSDNAYVNSLGANNTNGTTTTTSTGGNGGLVQVTLNTTYSDVKATTTYTTVGMTMTNGGFSFPNFTPILGATASSGTTNNFVRFGDPLISRGEYAYRVVSLGNNYYQIDVEGRAQGTSPGASGSATQFVSRITLVLTCAPPTPGTFPGAMAWAGSGPVYEPNGTTLATNPVFTVTTGNDVANGTDHSSDGVNSAYGVAVQGTGSNALTFPAGNAAGGSGATLNGTDGTNVTATTWSNMATFVNQVRDQGGYSSSTGWTTANTFGAQGTPDTNGSGIKTAVTPGLAHYTYGAGPTPAAANWTTSIDPGTVAGIAYLKIPDNTTVSGDLITIHGASSAAAGIVIIDVGNNVTFSGYSTGKSVFFVDDGNPSCVNGAVIFYQRGSIILPETDKFPLIYSNGGGNHGLYYNDAAVQQALKAIKSDPKLVSYVVVQ